VPELHNDAINYGDIKRQMAGIANMVMFGEQRRVIIDVAHWTLLDIDIVIFNIVCTRCISEDLEDFGSVEWMSVDKKILYVTMRFP
jgi:hypothetical protein